MPAGAGEIRGALPELPRRRGQSGRARKVGGGTVAIRKRFRRFHEDVSRVEPDQRLKELGNAVEDRGVPFAARVGGQRLEAPRFVQIRELGRQRELHGVKGVRESSSSLHTFHKKGVPCELLDREASLGQRVRQFLRDYNRRHKVTILLTSHYMADIKELCERVIVIHRGAKIYDGALAQLENAGGARKKIITFEPALAAGDSASGSKFPESWKSAFGTTVRSDDGNKFTVCVSADNVVAVSQEILSTGPVADITIEDVPLEDVITELFAAQ